MSQTLVENQMMAIGQELSFSNHFDASPTKTPTHEDHAALSSPQYGSDQTVDIEFAPGTSSLQGAADVSKLQLHQTTTPQSATSSYKPNENGNSNATVSPQSNSDGSSPRFSEQPPSSQSQLQQCVTRTLSSRKVQARTEELRKTFNLDPTDQLVDDYVCALKKKILLQGRLYIFEHHMCFSCSLFGYHKIKVIPFDQISSITRRKNVGFPNSIEVIWNNGTTPTKKEFFTSFLKREEAFKLLVNEWAKHSEHGREYLSTSGMNTPVLTEEEDNTRSRSNDGGDDENDATKGNTYNKRKGRNGSIGGYVYGRYNSNDQYNKHDSDTEAMSPFSCSNGHSPIDRSPSPCPPGQRYIDNNTTTNNQSTPTTNNNNNDESSSSLSMQVTASIIDPLNDPQNSLILTDDATSSFRPINSNRHQDTTTNTTMNTTTNTLSSRIPEFEEIPSSAIDPSALLKEFDKATETAPPVPSHMQRVMRYTLPTTPEGFFHLFLSPESDFCVAFHEAQGHHSIKVSPWQRHFQVGPVRDLRFVTPLKGWRLGPPQTLCHQTQRFKVYAGKHLVFETSQVMSDIPYGDHFTVDTRWDVVPTTSTDSNTTTTGSGNNNKVSSSSSSSVVVQQCDVQVSISVPFSKNTMWKKFIERGVTDSSLEAYQMFRELAEGELAKGTVRGMHGSGGDGGHDADRALELFDADAAVLPPPSSPSTTATNGVIVDDDALPTRPIHRRVASRPSSPEELLPSTNEEWEALLSHIEPKFRGYIKALRRAQMASGGGGGGGSNNSGGGGSPSLVAPRHRRRGSATGRSADWTSHQLGTGAVNDTNSAMTINTTTNTTTSNMGHNGDVTTSPVSSPLPRVPEGRMFLDTPTKKSTIRATTTSQSLMRRSSAPLSSRISTFVKDYGWMMCIGIGIIIVCLQIAVLMSSSSSPFYQYTRARGVEQYGDDSSTSSRVAMAVSREVNALLSQVQTMQKQLNDVSDKAKKLQSMLN